MNKERNFSKCSPDLNGKRHILGATRFITDEEKSEKMLYVSIYHSPYAHASIKNIDISEALKVKGIAHIITAKDIPGENQIGHLMADEVLLADEKVMYIGQPILLVLSASLRDAELAIKKLKIEFEVLKPILEIDEAKLIESYYIKKREIKRGNFTEAYQNAPHQIKGRVVSGAQEHFYMETQRCRAHIGENGEVTLYSATQSTSEIQEITARVLGLSSKDITVDVRRLGGAFGGKERNATLFACLAALSAHISQRPVELSLPRHRDIECTGKRHPFQSDYEIAFDDQGKILAYKVDLFSNGGASIDLSIAILERAMLHAENAYYIPNIQINGLACRTNLPPNTAFRGFGGPQGIFVIENAIHRIARYLKKNPDDIRMINMYQEEEFTPYAQKVYDAPGDTYFKRCYQMADIQKLQKEVQEFNASHNFQKLGLASIPVKFGISFTTAFLNQGSALIWIYADGTLSVSHGGIEMGQSLNKKVALIVAKALGISIGRIRIESSNTKRVGNASPTAASSGTDINGNAARLAAEALRERLTQVASELLSCNPESIVFENDQIFNNQQMDQKISFEQLIHEAYMRRVDLGAHAFYQTPDIYFDREKGQGQPFYYYVNGVALVAVEVDLIHGNFKIKQAHIVHETGRTLDADVDKGQICGAFVQGYGWCTMEEENFNHKGQYLALTPSTYKFPSIQDVPEIWNIEMVEKDLKKASVYKSKAIGEPPFIYGEAVWFAIKDAIESIVDYQTDAELKHPATPDAILTAIDQLKKLNKSKY